MARPMLEEHDEFVIVLCGGLGPPSRFAPSPFAEGVRAAQRNFPTHQASPGQ
jgi:hypothetical protein